MGLIDRIGSIFESNRASGPQINRPARTSERIETTVRAFFPGSSFSEERAGNVSLGGFCFEHATDLPVGSRVRLLIELTGTKHWIRVTGEVLGTAPRGKRVGVRGRFSKIHSDDREELERWLEALTCQTRAA